MRLTKYGHSCLLVEEGSARLLLDGDGGIGVIGVGANLGDAVWWTLVVLGLWALPLGVIGAAAGSLPARRRRQAVSTGSE